MCVCVRAAEGHASQVGGGINTHVNANEGWKISPPPPAKKQKKKGLFHNSYRKKVVFKCFLTNAWFCDYTGSFHTERSV